MTPVPPDSPETSEEAEEAELDRLAAALGKGPELPEDLVELMWAIATQSFVRMAEPDAAPFQFGRFEALDTKFGERSMVIEARDPQFDRKVAIKIWMSTSPQAEAVFAHVVTIYETGKWRDRIYVVMQWVDPPAANTPSMPSLISQLGGTLTPPAPAAVARAAPRRMRRAWRRTTR